MNAPLHPALPPTARAPRTLFRAALLGSLLTAGTAALTPWNDYVAFNTLATGGFFPPAVALTLFVLVILVNAPLHAFRPRSALSPRELAVVLGMLMVGCSVPGQGMMRSFLPSLVSPFYYQGQNPAFADAWRAAHIPSWLFPVDPALGSRDRVVTEFYGRTPLDAAPPYSAWIRPVLVWSVFVAAVYTTLLAMASLLRQQWAHNERLPFPISQLEAALIQPPQPGHYVNDLIGARSFWIALVAVLAIHLTNGLSAYFPRYVPEIPLKYNLTPIMSQPPWTYLNGNIKSATLYFTVVGLMYFIPGRIGLSLFSVWLSLQLIDWGYQAGFQTTIGQAAYNDQHLGAALAFAVGVAWVGRQHWARVLRHLAFGPAAGDTSNYRTPALLLIAGVAVMFGWILLAGAGLGIAALSVGLLLLSHLVVARVVAETGIPIFRTTLTPQTVVNNFPTSLLSGRDVYLSSTLGIIGGAYNTRESVLGTSLTAHRLHDTLEPTPRERRSFVALLAWALLLAFASSAASGLWCYYHYATPIAPRVQAVVINPDVLITQPQAAVVEPMVQHAQGAFAGKAHNPVLHVAIGAVVMLALQLGAWASAAFPIAPIGYLAGTTWYLQMLWYSIAVGWLTKALLVRFGGSSLYRAARPFFVGLVFGECLAATLWLLVSLTLALTHSDYREIRLLPT